MLLGVLPLAGVQIGQASDGPLLSAPAPAVEFRPARLAGLEGYACASCHADVAREWAASAHGLAWVDETYRESLKSKKRPELCYGCHTPEPLLAGLLGAAPEARAEPRGFGVSCESCHADDSGTVLGLHGTPTDAHRSQASPHLAVPGSNALCSACHATNIGPVIGIAKDFAAAKLAERGLSCVGCHMAPVERPWASDAPPRTGRSHAIQTPRDPAFLRLAFGRTAHTSAGKTTVVVENQAGHRVPGLVGREITFRAELLDAGGATLEKQELRLDERAYLPVAATRELRFTRAGAAVHLVGLHKDPRAKEPVTFLDEKLATQ